MVITFLFVFCFKTFIFIYDIYPEVYTLWCSSVIPALHQLIWDNIPTFYYENIQIHSKYIAKYIQSERILQWTITYLHLDSTVNIILNFFITYLSKSPNYLCILLCDICLSKLQLSLCCLLNTSECTPLTRVQYFFTIILLWGKMYLQEMYKP